MVKRTELLDDRRMRAQRRPVVAEPVKVTTSWPVEMVEQVADGAADQLQRTLGQDARSRRCGGPSASVR